MSYITARYDATVRQVSADSPVGDIAWAYTFTLYTDQALTMPVSLVGCTGEFLIGPPVNIELSTAGAQLVLGGTAGTVAVSLTVAQVNAQSSVCKPGYFLQLTDAGGNVGIPVNGILYWAAAQPGGQGY